MSSPDKLVLVLGPFRILAQSILPSALVGLVLRNALLATRQGHSLCTDLTAGIEAVFLLGSPQPSGLFDGVGGRANASLKG